jgi:glycosyltransferase involved in cell wall biosynthesis
MVDVSIIIPTFNRLWCLPRAINSCRNTNCKIEIIVVDDGSTDGTSEWLVEQKELIFVTQKNMGQTYAINHGYSISSGKFIRFLDSDDFLEEGIIDKQFNKAVETGADLIYSRVDEYDESRGIVKKFPDLIPWDDFIEIQLSNRYGSHFLGMLFNKWLIEKVPRRPDYALREDRMFLLEIGLLNPKIAMVEGCAGYWVQHSQQMQRNYNGLRSQVANWQHLNIYKYILHELEKLEKLNEARKEAACTVLWPLAHWIAKNDIKEAKTLIEWIFELNPKFEIPEKGILKLMYRLLGFIRTEKILNIRRAIKY